MNVPTLKQRGWLSLFCLTLAAAACDSNPTEPTKAAALRPAASASVQVSEFPVIVNFQVFSACLNGPVRLAGTAFWTVHTVLRPDGSRHLTILMDVAGPTLSAGSTVWTASPGASEMFVRNFPAGSSLEQQLEHQGTVIYRANDDSPDLRFVHRIHLIRDPDTGAIKLNNQLFEIVCVGQNN